ncbi:hypothetical protein [Embleya sp. NPDC001921]
MTPVAAPEPASASRTVGSRDPGRAHEPGAAAEREPETPAAEAPGFRPRWNRALAPVAALAIGMLGYHARWVCDDALIFTRAVREILAGNGPVSSPGERAEASTSTLWQWLLALFGFVLRRSDTTALSWLLGLFLTCAAVLFAVDAARRLHTRAGRTESLLVPFGILIPLGLRPMWEYATSGLETGLNMCWTAGSWWLLVRLRAGGSRRRALATAAVIGLGPLVRPEAAAVTVVFLLALWLIRRPTIRGTFALAGVAAAVPTAYQIFRMGYYGIVFPMPALTKGADGSLWERGWAYVTDFSGPYLLWAPLSAIVIGAGYALRGIHERRGDTIVVLAPPAAAAILFGYVVKVGGDYMHARMLVPILFLLLLPVAVLPLSRAVAAPALALAVWSAISGILLRYSPSPTSMVGDERAFYARFTGSSHPTSARDFLRTHPLTKAAVQAELASGRRSLIYYGPRLEGDIITVPLREDIPARVAVIGVYLGTAGALSPADVRLVDYWGLVNPIGARFELPVTKPGHSKPLSNAWLLAAYADPAAPVNPAGNFARPEPVTPEQVTAARHALGCGELAELAASTRAPMTAGRFLDNLEGSWRRTHLTIPADPFEAERRFCGRNTP